MNTTLNDLFVQHKPPISVIIAPFQEFASRQSSGGILLLAATLSALVWANSPWAESYASLLHTNIVVGAGGFTLSRDLHFWVNDALMAVFFFVVGLEIKREVMIGELASVRKAALPIIAAAGGVVFPALIYLLLNAGKPGEGGWGVPMATDIAFAVGVMALLGSRVPIGLKVFLTALAIVDDIAAVLVIAFFYTAQISWGALGMGWLCLAALLVANRLGVRSPIPYAIIGFLLWLAVLESGVHATIAGVLAALTIPARTVLDASNFVEHSRFVISKFEAAESSDEQNAATEALEDACEKVQPPLHRLEHGLHPWVTFGIMPLFALTNAGVDLSGPLSFTEPVTLGVILGLLIGKPLGITLASFLAVRFNLGSLPLGVTWRHIHGAGWLGGIGFTMSLFVADLAFSTEAMLAMAKLGILGASSLAGVAGAVILLGARSARDQS